MFNSDADKWKKIERSLDKIPSLSPAVSKVIMIANDLRSSPRDLLRVISLDPVLTGKVLKLVNSAYFGTRTNITSLNRALIMLGVNTIKNLALSTAVLATMQVKERDIPLDMDKFWTHSLSVAVGCKLLAKLLDIPENQREEFFITGLLHDIGKIPLIRFFPDEFRENMEMADKHSMNLYEAEDIKMQISHSEIGGRLAELWRLTPSLTFCIQHHHDPLRPNEHKKLNQCVFIANNYCKKIGQGFSGNHMVEDLYEDVIGSFGHTEAEIEEVFGEMNDEVSKARIFLQTTKGA